MKLVQVQCSVNGTKDEAYSFFLALLGSSQLAMVFMFGPLVGSLIDFFGMRKVSLAGGFLYSVGLISASYVNSIYGLFPTFALIISLASSLLYPSTQITPVKCISSKYQGIACSFVSCGGYTGTLSFSLLITFLLEQFHWKVMFRILAYLGVVICLLSLTYGWIEGNEDIPERNRTPFCNWSLCKRPRYFVFMFGSAVAMLGWQVGNFFLVRELTIPYSRNCEVTILSTDRHSQCKGI